MADKLGRALLYIGQQGARDIEAIIGRRQYNPKRDGSRVVREALAREAEAARKGEDAVEPKRPRREGVRHG